MKKNKYEKPLNIYTLCNMNANSASFKVQNIFQSIKNVY